MDLDSVGRILLLLGIGIAIFGGLLMLANRVPLLSQLFNSGTIRIETGNVSCFFPILAMIVLSILFTVIANVVIRFLNR
jgi:hypothetical protein